MKVIMNGSNDYYVKFDNFRPVWSTDPGAAHIFSGEREAGAVARMIEDSSECEARVVTAKIMELKHA